jgi:hypothetical protein
MTSMPVRLWDVEAPSFSIQSAHRWRWGFDRAVCGLSHSSVRIGDTWRVTLQSELLISMKRVLCAPAQNWNSGPAFVCYSSSVAGTGWGPEIGVPTLTRNERGAVDSASNGTRIVLRLPTLWVQDGNQYKWLLISGNWLSWKWKGRGKPARLCTVCRNSVSCCASRSLSGKERIQLCVGSWNSHDSDCEEYCHVGCYAVQSGTCVNDSDRHIAPVVRVEE